MRKTNEDLNHLLNQSNPGQTPFLLSIYFAFRDRLWLVVLALLVGVIAAAVHYSKTPLLYEAKMVLMLELDGPKVVKVDGLTQVGIRNHEEAQTLLETLRSRHVLQRTVQKLKLNTNPKFLVGTGMQSTSEENAASMLGSMLSVELQKKTILINLFVKHRDSEIAKQIANTLVEEFLHERFEQRVANIQLANKFLAEESARLKDKLQKSEEALHRYEVEHDAISLVANQDTVIAQLKEMSSKLTQAKTHLLTLESDVSRAKQLAGKPDELILIPSVASLSNIVNLKNAIADKESEIVTLSQTYKPKHPKYSAAIVQLNNLKEQLDKAILHSVGILEAQFQTAQETEAQFAQAVKEHEKKALELNGIAIPYNARLREIESDRAMFEAILTRLKETDVVKGVQEHPFHIEEPVIVSTVHRTSAFKTYGLGLFGGFVIASSIIIALYMFDSSLKTVEEVEQFLKVPVLGCVPKETKSGSLPTLHAASGKAAEAIRELRTVLSFLGPQESRRVFLFLSAIPSEGKTFVSCNYAVSSAQTGISTLLIDADLRKPAVSKLFLGDLRKLGLSDCLVGKTTLEEVTCSTEVKNLSILPAGSLVPNPADLLSSPEFSKLLDEALRYYDRIVIDSSPINTISDTLMIVPHVQTTCLVVGARSTSRTALNQALRLLFNIQCVPSGCILNFFQAFPGSGYYYHHGYREEVKPTESLKVSV